MSCYDCQRDPGLKEAWGCDGPTQAAVWIDDETDDEYYVCPARLLPENIIEWYNEYTYNKEFSGSAPAYHDQGEKWLDVASMYNKFYRDAVDKMQEQAKSKTSNRMIPNG